MSKRLPDLQEQSNSMTVADVRPPFSCPIETGFNYPQQSINGGVAVICAVGTGVVKVGGKLQKPMERGRVEVLWPDGDLQDRECGAAAGTDDEEVGGAARSTHGVAGLQQQADGGVGEEANRVVRAKNRPSLRANCRRGAKASREAQQPSAPPDRVPTLKPASGIPTILNHRHQDSVERGQCHPFLPRASLSI